MRFRTLVRREAHRQHRVADYAAQLAISPGHLNALCRRHDGRSAKQIILARLAQAAERALRDTHDPVAQVAAALGFDDASYFARFVRRSIGCAPVDLRRAAPAEPTP